jgi:6-phosphogluconolactonase (cycloisomerase 2 family)
VGESVGNTRSEVCWAVVGKDGRHAYVTNFGYGTISSYGISADGTIELLAGGCRLERPGTGRAWRPAR